MKRWGCRRRCFFRCCIIWGRQTRRIVWDSIWATIRALTVAEALADLIDAPHSMRRYTLNGLLVNYGPEKKAPVQHSLKSSALRRRRRSKCWPCPSPVHGTWKSMMRTALSNESGPAAPNA